MKNENTITSKEINGKTYYFQTLENGKKVRVSRNKAEEIIAAAQNEEEMEKMENKETMTIVSLEDEAASIAAVTEMDEAMEAHNELALAAKTAEPTTVGTAADIAVEVTAAPAVSKMTKKAEKEARWLAKALINEDGKYLVVPELDYKGYTENAGWKPCFYIVTTDYTLTRIGLKFAVELAAQGRAIEVSKDQMKESKKAAKAAKKSETKKVAQPVEQDDSSSFEEILHLIPTWQSFEDEEEDEELLA